MLSFFPRDVFDEISLYINIKKGKIVVKCYTSRLPPVWEIAVHLAVAGDGYDGVFLCCPFSHAMSWMRSWTKLSHFRRVFLPTLTLFDFLSASF